MQSPLQQLINQITKLKERHIFFFVNTANGRKISKGYAGKYQSQNVWEFEDIIKKYTSVEGFLKHLKNEGIPSVEIMFYKKHGNRYLKSEIPDVTCVLNQNTQALAQPAQTQQTPQAMTPQTPQAPVQNVALAGPGQNIALGFAQYMDFEKKATRLEIIEAENNRIQQELQALKAEKASLQLKLDEAMSKCSLADERLILEKEKITNGTKSSFENLMQTPAAIAIADKLPGVLENLLKHSAEIKAGNTALAGGAVADPFEGLTEAQQQLIKVLIASKLSDEMALNVYNIFVALNTNPSLMVSFNQFINNQQAG